MPRTKLKKEKTETELDDYMGIPMPGSLKRRIKEIADRNVPKVKPAPMARSLLERAVEREEAATAEK